MIEMTLSSRHRIAWLKSNQKFLKVIGLSISRDYPEEIRKARQSLELKCREAVAAKKMDSIIFQLNF